MLPRMMYLVLYITLLTGVVQAEEQLSREYARDAILKSKEIQAFRTAAYLTTRGCKKDLQDITLRLRCVSSQGEKLGMWTATPGMWTPTPNNAVNPVLTAKGQTLISHVNIWFINSFIKLITPTMPSVQVTGIADSTGGAKRAEFSWEHKNLPQEIQPLVCGGIGQAIFQHYDDGWRVSSVEDTGPRSDCE